MCQSKFSEVQVIGHAAGLTAAEICGKYGISDATFYKWRSRYGGMEMSDGGRLKALEEENRKLDTSNYRDFRHDGGRRHLWAA
jgi:putative transposase